MPPRRAQEPPSELDRLDPAPAPRRPARPPPRRKGPAEKGVLEDLKAFPAELRKGGIAAIALLLAIEIDTVPMSPRDKAAMAGQVRMAMITLREIAPGEARGDRTDEVRERREKRLTQG